MSSAALGLVVRDVGFLPKNASRNSEGRIFWIKGSVFTSPHGLNMRPKSSTKAVRVGKRRSLGSEKSASFLCYYGLTTPPYKLDALEPFMSKRTLELHWGVYHRDCVERLNEQLKNSSLYGSTLEELVKTTYNNGNPLPEFNNAAEAWNHDFFWESMQPDSGSMPWGSLLHQIEKDFGSFSNFKDKFMESAMGLFGSGWIWLVLKREEKMLAVVRTSHAVCPLIFGDFPIISLDMWEHAYYLDYKEDRRRYVSNYMNHLVSWHSATLRIVRAEAFVNLGEPKVPSGMRA
ncbi:superoxide dismutase [Fe] 2, chloroplastic-like [Phalaenopsis equestris]|uniref:superoxide dismutase [Fe] 2, chloroplastic-like n=1 Tax=Phalaenopsis equestris TaxID=78828 RepID=UPI0009E271DD|nr:superoxide dismutase [Fe] 2, chloroplastic-like [Phalaenopsis equestris]